MFRRQSTPRRRPAARGRGRPNFRATPPRYGAQTATRPDTKVEKRVIARDLLLSLASVSGDNTFYTFRLDDFLYRYTGSEAIVDAFDQYRYDKIECFVKLNGANTATRPDPIASLKALRNTTATSVIDLDSGTPMSGAEITSYSNAKETAIGWDWKRIAVYSPAIGNVDTGTVGLILQDKWLDTARAKVSMIGLQTHIENPAGAQYFGTSATTCQKVEIRVRAHLSVRGRRSLITSKITFFQQFVGSILTVHSPVPTTRTISSYAFPSAPGSPFTFRWAGSAIDIPISTLITMIQDEQTPAGVSITWDGPLPPQWLGALA